jgi:hypothetical protein
VDDVHGSEVGESPNALWLGMYRQCIRLLLFLQAFLNLSTTNLRAQSCITITGVLLSGG